MQNSKKQSIIIRIKILTDKCWDTAGEKVNSLGKTCNFYANGGGCGLFDSDHFDASKMCCGCGGGRSGKISVLS